MARYGNRAGTGSGPAPGPVRVPSRTVSCPAPIRYWVLSGSDPVPGPSRTGTGSEPGRYRVRTGKGPGPNRTGTGCVQSGIKSQSRRRYAIREIRRTSLILLSFVFVTSESRVQRLDMSINRGDIQRLISSWLHLNRLHHPNFIC